MFCQPTLITTHGGRDTQSEAFFAQQCIATVARTIRPDFTRLWIMHDVFCRVTWPCNILLTFGQSVVGSKSLASMLPTMISSGIITLVVTAVMRVVWLGVDSSFLSAWMEAWLITWSIAFPVAYMIKPVVNQLARKLSN